MADEQTQKPALDVDEKRWTTREMSELQAHAVRMTANGVVKLAREASVMLAHLPASEALNKLADSIHDCFVKDEK